MFLPLVRDAVIWSGSGQDAFTKVTLVVDLLNVVWMTDQYVLVDELRPEVAPLLRAAAHRQRSLVLLPNPGASLGSPKFRLHAAGTRSDRVGDVFVLWWIRTVLMFLLLEAKERRC